MASWRGHCRSRSRPLLPLASEDLAHTLPPPPLLLRLGPFVAMLALRSPHTPAKGTAMRSSGKTSGWARGATCRGATTLAATASPFNIAEFKWF
ncbi:hypothetical protein MTO96_024229 [Rhipicephalus appendiculatus]